MNYVWKVDAASKVTLKDYDPGYTDKQSDRASANLELQQLSDELSELQELLAAAQQQSLLVVLQGMDTSGKDGTIRHVLSHVNPQGCYVHAFKECAGGTCPQPCTRKSLEPPVPGNQQLRATANSIRNDHSEVLLIYQL